MTYTNNYSNNYKSNYNNYKASYNNYNKVNNVAKSVTDTKATTDSKAHKNHFSGHVYGMKNQMILSKLWFTTPEWMTYKQARFNNLRIKRWEHAARICYNEFKDEKQEDGTIKKVPVTTYHLVFNVEQTEPVIERA